MIFHSFLFNLAFLPLLLVAYLIVRKSSILSTLVLVIGSAVFYAWQIVWWLVPLAISAVVDYIVGVKMSAPTLTDDKVRKRLLLISVVVNLTLLSIFKYLGWLTVSLNDLFAYFGLAASVPVIHATLPPGISFYTFQTMSYSIDVYRGDYTPERRFLVYLNFVLFFPQLVAGPIVRAKDLIGQLRVVRPPASADDIRLALCQIFWGLFKKIVLADNLGDVVSFAIRMTDTPPFQSAGAGLLYGLGFALQIYCDFSAYSDIARGSARLFGIELPRNFITPLLARSPREFWQRWHITLSTWIRDYLYIPLGGNRGSAAKQGITMLLTMGLAGLWHGAGLMFIGWGLYHGLLIVIYRLPAIKSIMARCETGVPAVAAGLLFFALNVVGWMMFRAGSGREGEFGRMFASLGQLPEALHLQSFQLGLGQLALLATPLFLSEWMAYRRQTEFPEVLHHLTTPQLAGALTVMWFGAVIFAKRSGYDFIYFAF